MEQQTTAIQVGSHVLVKGSVAGRAIEIFDDRAQVVFDDSPTFEWGLFPFEDLELLNEPTPEQTVRSLIIQAQHHLERAESIITKLRAMDAHKLLGFNSWEAFCWKHFAHNRQYLYRQLHAAQVRARLYQHVSVYDRVQLDTLSESIFREFKVADTALWDAIYDSAKQIGGGTVTAKAVRQASNTYADVLQHGTVDGVPLSEVVAAGAVDLMVSRNAANSDLHWVVSRANAEIEEAGMYPVPERAIVSFRIDETVIDLLRSLKGHKIVLSIGVKDGA